MKLILGLGNIGSEYCNTRHNVGFMVLDYYAAQLRKSFVKDKYYDYLHLRDAVLVKPLTYMNRSGLALETALRTWKVDDILVIYDDLELEVADLRFRSGGGDGGHNGIKSLLTVIEPAKLKRIRIGIGRNTDSKAEKYVLQAIPEAEQESFTALFPLLCGFLKTYIARDFTGMLNEYSTWKKTCSGKSDAGIISPKED